MTGKNLKIPSRWITITGGPYKGYEAEYKERLRKGEFLIVVIGATGNQATIPVYQAGFLLDDGSVVQYDKEYNLSKIGQRDPGQIVKATENVDSPTNSYPLFSVENVDDSTVTDLEVVDDIDVDENYENSFYSDVAKNSRESVAIELEQVYEASYETEVTSFVEATVKTNTEKVLGEILRILDLNFDVKTHSKNLDLLFRSDVFDTISLEDKTTFLYFVASYVFIQINNLSLGYSNVAPGILVKPNDDPSYIEDVLYKFGIFKERVDLVPYIRGMLSIMKTSVIPSLQADPLKVLSKRFSILNLEKSGVKKESVKATSLKKLRFPLYETTESKTFNEIKVKEVIFKKIDLVIENPKTDQVTATILKGLISKFDKYVKGEVFKTLKDNPDSLQSELILPYIEEYKKLVDVEEDLFYQKIQSRSIALPKTSARLKIEKLAIEKVRNTIFNSASDKDDKMKLKIRDIFLKNIEKIASMKPSEIKKLKISSKTLSKEDQSYINTTIGIKEKIDATKRKIERTLEKETFNSKRQKTKEDILQKKIETLKISPKISLKVFK